jgi:predicted dehydrogenase
MRRCMSEARLRMGLVGAGHFGRFHALKIAAAPRADLVGVYDVDQARASAVGREAGGAPAMALAALLEACQAVVIAAPAEAHHDLATQALEAGCHVLVEKPIAATLAQADALAALRSVAASPGRSISKRRGSPPTSPAAPMCR